MKRIKAAVVQFEHADGDKAANLSKIESFVAKADAEGVELLIFPECCVTGYWFLRHLSRGELEELAEPVPGGAICEALRTLAAERSMSIGAGLVERDEDGGLYNTYVVAEADGSIHSHRKLHTFVSEHMTSGSETTVFDSMLGCRLGILTCYDNNLNENVRLSALQGAEIILAPHQTGGCASKDPNIMGLVDPALWENRVSDPESIEKEFRGDKGRGWLLRWLPSRAHDNGVFYLFANGVGMDDDEVRTGNAMIIDPYGRILNETWKADDEIVLAELEPELRVDNTGQRWMSARRPELYKPLAEATGQEVDIRTARFSGKGA